MSSIDKYLVKAIDAYPYNLVLCLDKELNEMRLFFQISALKILAVATAMPVFFALIFEKMARIII